MGMVMRMKTTPWTKSLRVAGNMQRFGPSANMHDRRSQRELLKNHPKQPMASLDWNRVIYDEHVQSTTSTTLF
jgi:hypothetical protein